MYYFVCVYEWAWVYLSLLSRLPSPAFEHVRCLRHIPHKPDGELHLRKPQWRGKQLHGSSALAHTGSQELAWLQYCCHCWVPESVVSGTREPTFSKKWAHHLFTYLLICLFVCGEVVRRRGCFGFWNRVWLCNPTSLDLEIPWLGAQV